MPKFQFTIRRLMVVIALTGILVACGVEGQRWYERAEFARKYKLGQIIIGSGVDVRKGVFPKIVANLDRLDQN
jgi:hypothetical protein